MNSSKKKRSSIIVIVIGAIVFVSGIIISNLLASQKKDPASAIPKPKVKRVKTVEVFYDTNPENIIKSHGRVNAINKIDISAEVSGKIFKGNIELRVGESFKKGDLLFKIDNRIQSFNLSSKKSDFISLVASQLPDLQIDFTSEYEKWNTFYKSITVNDPLPRLPEFASETEKTFFANRNVLKTYFTIKADEVQLEKFSVTAPFSGTIGSVFFQEGASVNAGVKIATLISGNNLEVEIPIDPEYLKWLQKGQKIELKDKKTGDEYIGKLIRISDAIDSKTHLINIYASVSTKSHQNLFDGSFLSATIYGSDLESGFEIPRKALYDRKYVKVLRDTIIETQNVEILQMRDETALIKGIEEGKHVIIQGISDDLSRFKTVEVLVSKDEYKATIK